RRRRHRHVLAGRLLLPLPWIEVRSRGARLQERTRAEQPRGASAPLRRGVDAAHRRRPWRLTLAGANPMSPQPSRLATLVALAALLAFAAPVRAARDAERGARVARLCMACHSFEPGRHMTGPSLAGVWGRKAGAAEGFARYSEALQRSGLVWDEQHLDAWLKDPAALVPGNEMAFSGIDDARTRANLLAYLEAAS